MTRGRYGASAAKRRAESAEEQLDRLMPQLVDAQRIAKRYKSEAERVPLLLRQIEELKRQVGVPLEQHEAALHEAQADFDEMVAEYEGAARRVFNMLERQGDQLFRDDIGKVPTIDRDGRVLEALFILGIDVVEPLLRALGWERWYRRHLVIPDFAERVGRREQRERRSGLSELDQHDMQSFAKWKSAKIAAARAAAAAEEESDVS